MGRSKRIFNIRENVLYHLLFEKIQDGATNKRNERIVAASVLKY